MSDKNIGGGSAAGQWYFNTSTQLPEQGKKTRIEHRMGPYESKAEALKAWKIVQQRNKKWEDDDRKWEDAGENGTDHPKS
ncbi:MAG: hypothetical protein LKJ47_05315 [Bifidobacteriaceae bacterium]|nr:hypothetical protein [Bifidobacteriaceae bacterium]